MTNPLHHAGQTARPEERPATGSKPAGEKPQGQAPANPPSAPPDGARAIKPLKPGEPPPESSAGS